jgi:cobalamin biosynthesis protein CobD/CbiB
MVVTALSRTGTDVAALAGRAWNHSRHRAIRLVFCGAAALLPFVSGCAVVSVVATAATVTVGVVSTAIDVGIGAVKVTGKVIGKGVDAVTGSGPTPPVDSSGLSKPAPN